MLKEKRKVGIGSLMLVSLCPEPVFYICSLVPTNSTMNLEPSASGPTHPHQNKPTANEGRKTQEREG